MLRTIVRISFPLCPHLAQLCIFALSLLDLLKRGGYDGIWGWFGTKGFEIFTGCAASGKSSHLCRAMEPTSK